MKPAGADGPAAAVDAALAALPDARPELREAIVAFSGGADSMALLLRARAVLPPRWSVAALHVAHGLHPDGERWIARCQALCAELGVPLTVRRASVRRTGAGVEADARWARYEVFRAELSAGRALLLAHHRNDQAETFLLNAARGAGPDGLAAMPSARRLGTGWLLRPLLSVSRAELAAIVAEAGLDPIEDPMNHDLARERAFLRERLVPSWSERRPGLATALARSARLCGESRSALAWFSGRECAQRREGDGTVLVLAGLAEAPPSVQAAVLRHWLAGAGVPLPGAARLRELQRQLAAREDATVAVAWDAVSARRWRGRLWLDVPPPAPPRGWSAVLDGDRLALPAGLGELIWRPRDPTRPAGARPALSVRFRAGGERLRLAPDRPSRPVKALLQEAGLPPWVRSRLPFIELDGELVAVGDGLATRAFEERLTAGNWRLSLSVPSLAARLAAHRGAVGALAAIAPVEDVGGVADAG